MSNALAVLCLSCLLVPAALVAHAQDPAAPPAPRPGEALVVIDIQQFYFEGGLVPLTGPVEAARQARVLIDHFRQKHLPVIHVRHLSKNTPDGEQYTIHPSVLPLPGEKVVTKQYANSFRDTDLLEYLRKAGITRLVIVGMQTHMCVEAATRAAADFGFDVTVVSDACATRPLEYGGVKVPADEVHAAALAAMKGSYAKVVTVAEFLGRDGAPGR